jgi:hypothetical protein
LSTVAARRSSGVSVAALGVERLPVLTALAYVAVVAVSFPALARAVFWDSDAASPFVLVEHLRGHGAVVIPRFGWWSSLWWLLTTRHLPGHVVIWEATGYVFAVATAVLVGWGTARLAERWAGMTAASAVIVVGPPAVASLLTVNFHTTTPFTAAVLALYLVFAPRNRSWLLAAGVGLLAGVNAASDPLLWLAGIAPFVAAAALYAVMCRRRDVAARGGLVLVVAVVSMVGTDRVMSALGYHLIPVSLQLAGLGDVVPNLIRLGKSAAGLYGANFFAGPYPDPQVRYLIALLAFGAVGALLLLAVRSLVRRSNPQVTAYVSFWALSVAFLGLAFWFTNQATGIGPAGGSYYLLTLAPASATGVALLAARSDAGRITAAIAIATVGGVNVASIAQGRGQERAGAAVEGPQLIHILEQRGLTHGYAPYWDAQSLTWNSGNRLFVAPVQACDPTFGGGLCRFPGFTIDSWYQPRPGRSFLIVDPAAGLSSKPPKTLRPVSTLRVGPQTTVYFFSHDIAGQIRHRHYAG